MEKENKFGGIEDLPDEEFEEEEENEIAPDGGSFYFEEPPEDRTVIGVKFRTSAKVYYFDPDGKTYPEGAHAIVETARGQEYGLVAQTNHVVSGREIVLPLRKALRVATPEDDAHEKENVRRAEEAFGIGVAKIAEHGLDMKLIDTEYTFDNGKLLFYFTSDGRVDFRELVKDLASVFRCRIELRQMGIRDEAKILGGLGICGRPFCCHAFLPDFVQVSIKMAKEQNLALNSAKISGACGRLMCCLRYEYDAYIEEGRLTPKVDALVNTPDGIGIVVESKPLTGMVKVKSLDDNAGMPRVYRREQLTPIQKGDENYERALEEKSLEKQAKAAGTTRAALKAAMNMTPEKAAQQQARAERALRPTRPEPKRAASYTGQVTPLALEAGERSRLDPSDAADSFYVDDLPEETDAPAARTLHSSHRGRRRGQRNGGDRGRAQGYPSDARPAEKKGRYEKVSKGDRPAQEKSPAQNSVPAQPQENKPQKKGYRPFRKRGKK